MEAENPLSLDEAAKWMERIHPVLSTYSYLPWPWIYALAGKTGNEARFGQVCSWLMKKPHQKLIVPDKFTEPGKLTLLTHPYALPPRPRARPVRFDKHTTMTMLARASVHYGCKQHGFTFIPWVKAKALTETVHHEALNDRTSVRIPLGGKLNYIPDDCFLIDYGDHRYRRFVVEIDRATEQLEDHPEKHKTIAKMYAQIKKVRDEQLYRTHLGFRDCLFLIICPTEGRKRSLMNFWKQQHGPATYVLFSVFPEWEAEPTARLLETPWQRVGNPDFNMMELPNAPR